VEQILFWVVDNLKDYIFYKMSSTPKINLKTRRETILKSRAVPKKLSDSVPAKQDVVVPNPPTVSEEIKIVDVDVPAKENTIVENISIQPQNPEPTQPETCEIRDGVTVCPGETISTSVPSLKKDSKSKDYDKILNICNSGISSIQGNIETLRTRLVTNKSEFKSLNDASKYLDNIRKYIVAKKNSMSKNAGSNDDRKKNMNSGFLKKKQLTQETIDFFGLDNEPRSRVDMTRLICSYVRDKQLQDPENRKQVILDEPLKKLLKYEGTPSIPYFDVQKYFGNFFAQ